MINLISNRNFNGNIEEKFNKIENLLQGMVNDRSVPRNIKKIIQEGLKFINIDNNPVEFIASKIISLMKDLSSDNNIPYHSRSTINRVLSILETIKD